MSGRELWRKLGLAAAAAIVLGVAMPLVYGGEWNLWVSLGIVSALWIVLPMVRDLFDKTRTIRRSIIEEGQDDARPDFGRGDH
mgnify:CR=1 FL=1